jgi:peptidoglycan hydrolase-like protein with peptidoglycan-binding domain/3D (Asp-Asp-Asp) domain-containing protein
MHIPKRIFATVAFVVLIHPGQVGSNREPYEQDFFVTAYYSPLPDQCCYVRGGYEADKVLNGEGVKAADGTAVYPGMLAAPPSYPFGTKVALSGIGILAVHDRGGAIQEQGGVHRLDVWAGYGEEGLARALAFGAQRVRGTVYPPGFHQPQTKLALDDLPAPLSKLENYKLAYLNLLSVRAQKEDHGLSVKMLQTTLKEMGYFRHAVTGRFGEVTEQSLAHFLSDYHLSEPTDALTPTAAAFVLSAEHRRGVKDPISGYVDQKANATTLREAQRILRFLGYYRGRTDGIYSDALAGAILHFQKDYYLVGTENDAGAGRIGPLTMQQIRGAWDRLLVAERARKYLLLHKVEQHVAKNNLAVEQFLSEGDYGTQVRTLQSLLADRGFFPEAKINGNFGPLTGASVTQYQLSRDLISSSSAHGAGVVGPATLAALQREERSMLYQLVRATGWQAL